MQDNIDVKVGSSEEMKTASQLFEYIRAVERFTLGEEAVPGYNHASRQWILDTFASCVRATKGVSTA
ncbi:hypothetical protein NKJ36_12605 [Mesorhizobium sp. M0142]|uniref:hypothetical protein n=1 Tax=Mesorhizobium sp. M0142 TaxID=2956894 RepID=UPI00333C0441